MQNNSSTHDSIELAKLETQFVFFYDLNLKIIGREGGTPLPKSEHFEWHDLNTVHSSLPYFSDAFPAKLVVGRFHCCKNKSYSEYEAFLDRRFELSNSPIGQQEARSSYAPIEGTIYSNGMLAILIRLKIRDRILDRDYLPLIARPEFVRLLSTETLKPGALVAGVDGLMEKLEQALVTFLNKCRIDVATMFDGGAVGTLQLYTNIPPEGKRDVWVDKRFVHSRLVRSRPFIGSIVDIASERPAASDDHVSRFAIACGRTTPEFITNFVQPQEYLREGDPPRNIYHPGISIVFIGRRGWCCVNRENAIDLRFYQGIVETALFVLQTQIAAVRAMRRFQREVISQGQVVGFHVYHGLGRSRTSWNLPSQIGRYFNFRLKRDISGFAKFLANARLNSPIDDLGILLKSHLTTHTSIRAFDRIAVLTDYHQLMSQTRATLTSFAEALRDTEQYYRDSDQMVRYWLVLIALAGLLVNIVLGKMPTGLMGWYHLIR